ncbi:MAG: serine/threonine protein kinase [Myxococcales bacterium]|nr:serine/threonine protein kinase [Myxococcales bacterium]
MASDAERRDAPLARFGPIPLADLALTAVLRRRANLVVLQPRGLSYALVVKRGSQTLAVLEVPSEVGAAAVARLALLAGLDPLGGGVALTGSDFGRVKVRAADQVGELLISVATSPAGFEAEVRPLSMDGRAFEDPRRGQLKRCPRCGGYRAPEEQACDRDGEALVEVGEGAQAGGTIGVYRLGEQLSESASSTVWAGEHALIHREVAVKVLRHSATSRPLLARRFLAEARAASRIRHPNLVEVTDFGLLADERPYLVMDRIHGEALSSHLDPTRPLPPAIALHIAREVALALAALHEAGLVHRDLNPSHVVLLDGAEASIGARRYNSAYAAKEVSLPRLKVVDFGAAWLPGSDFDDASGRGGAAYMAPEVARGEGDDPRSDLYSLGVLLHEMLTGTVPFACATPDDVIAAHARSAPLAVAELGLADAVARVVGRALRRSGAERHQSADEMCHAIDRAIAAIDRHGWQRFLPS